MILETFLAHNISHTLHTKENFGHWSGDDIGFAVFFSLFLVIWLFTLVHAIRCAQPVYKLKNIQGGIILSVLSWPFYWLFYIVGATNYK